jgi:hypothetical protein
VRKYPFTHAPLQTEASRASHEQGWNGALDKLERYFLRMRVGDDVDAE